MNFLQSLLQEKIKPEEVEPVTAYQETLNPAIWEGDELKPEVKEKLLETAQAFEKALKIPNLKVVDVVLTGSGANYNWTSKSDIDVHVIADLDQLREDNPDILDNYLLAKKVNWNNTHKTKIHGFDVELYTQDKNEKHISSGSYSILNGKWVEKPKYEKPTIDDLSVRIKSAEIMDLIDKEIESGSEHLEEIEKTKEKIRKMRQSGLDEHGEFSVENLVFKTLRNNGYLKKLSDYYIEAFNKRLSLE